MSVRVSSCPTRKSKLVEGAVILGVVALLPAFTCTCAGLGGRGLVVIVAHAQRHGIGPVRRVGVGGD